MDPTQCAPSGGSCCQANAAAAAPVENSLAGFFGHLFDTSSYPARWNCGHWTEVEGWLHIVSDLAIFLAYFAIPIALVYFVCKRKDIPFNGIFFLFAAFILCCGTGHLLEAIIFYAPIYRIAGLLKLATAVVSWFTVMVLWRLVPKALELPALASKIEVVQKADAAKTEFLANMSHEIRTPMTAILGYADLLAEEATGLGVDREKRLEAVRTIQRNGEHLLGIINDILDLSKIEAGKLSVVPAPASPASIIEEVMGLLRVRSLAKGLELRVRYETPLPVSIQTDAIRLRQILMNLVGNAIKFTDAGEVELIVRLVAQDAPHLEFDVVDSGVGMSAELQARLFQPFTQADTSATRRFGGTGLGLVISKRLAELLGGEVTIIESVIGKGSRFRLRIATGQFQGVPTIVLGSPKPREPVTHAAPIQPESCLCLEGTRVLLAEDGLDNQRLISFILSKAGAKVQVVENGELAVAAALESRREGEPFDVVLMDMQMPVLDGYGAAAALRAQDYAGKIIALTAHAMCGDRDKCLSAGCDDYATKPIDRVKLIELIARHASDALELQTCRA